MKTPVVLGGAAIPVGRHQSKEGDLLKVVEHELLVDLIVKALKEACVNKEDVGSLVFSEPHVYTKQKYFCTFITAYLGFKCTGSVVEMLGNGMTGGLAFDRACDDVRLGRSKVALVLGANMETAVPSSQHMDITMRAVGDVDFQSPAGFTPISWYALDACRYMHEFGATREELSSVSVKNRFHASKNPLAQYRGPLSLEEVLSSKMIVEPLTLLDVPPRGDGAICLIVADEEYAKSLGQPYAKVIGRGSYHEGRHQTADTVCDMIAFDAARIAGEQAYATAGIRPDDISVAEIYAPCTIVEVLAAEAFSLLPRGMGARLIAEGKTQLGDRLVINSSGGCQSRGHPARLTPIYNAYELYLQLTQKAGERQANDGAIGLMSCELGNYNAALVHILEGCN